MRLLCICWLIHPLGPLLPGPALLPPHPKGQSLEEPVKTHHGAQKPGPASVYPGYEPWPHVIALKGQGFCLEPAGRECLEEQQLSRLLDSTDGRTGGTLSQPETNAQRAQRGGRAEQQLPCKAPAHEASVRGTSVTSPRWHLTELCALAGVQIHSCLALRPILFFLYRWSSAGASLLGLGEW